MVKNTIVTAHICEVQATLQPNVLGGTNYLFANVFSWYFHAPAVNLGKELHTDTNSLSF
jgi:hypothetical protein